MIWWRVALLSLRMLGRNRLRAVLAMIGIGVATFLLSAERAVHSGVAEATSANQDDTRLIVYRANRFCPFASKIPERYVDELLKIPGVKSAVPMQIVVSNCRASLDVVVFRGVRAEDAKAVLAPRMRVLDGSFDAFLSRGDGAMLGSALAARRGLKVGDRFTSAGLSVAVMGIVESDGPQDRNAAYVQLPFLQSSAGGVQGGDVTQFEVEVTDATQMREVARAIDERFATDRAPTSTRPEKAFVALAANDLVAIAEFAGWLGIGALAAVFALVANAIVLSLEARTREIAILQSVGFRGGLIAWSVVVESLALALSGSILGAGAAYLALEFGRFGLGADGVSVEFQPSLSVAFISIAAASIVGTVAGLVPALSAARRSIVEGMKSA